MCVFVCVCVCVCVSICPSPNVEPKPIGRSRSSSISRVLSQISRTVFHFSHILIIKGSSHKKKIKKFEFLKKIAHSPTFPSLHLRHSSFSNPSVALPTSQLTLQPFFRFSYVTRSSFTSLGEPPMSISQSMGRHVAHKVINHS